jgi:hypothetical protein
MSEGFKDGSLHPDYRVDRWFLIPWLKGRKMVSDTLTEGFKDGFWQLTDGRVYGWVVPDTKNLNEGFKDGYWHHWHHDELKMVSDTLAEGA